MALLPEERETNIQWSDVDKFARIFTCQRRMERKLAKNPRARLVATRKDINGRVTGTIWKIPAHCIRIIPGKIRRISEVQREAARQRMREVRKAVGR